MKRKEVYRARSKTNGIFFYSNIFPRIGTETIRDEDGKITSRTIFDTVRYDFFENYAEPKRKRFFSKKKIWAINVILLFIAILFREISYTFSTIFFVFLVSENFWELIEFILQVKKGSKVNEGKMHSAEHKVINAYKKLQRIPTIEEVRNASRFSKDCGSRIEFRKAWGGAIITLFIIVAPKMGLTKILITILLGIFLWTICSFCGIFKYLQIFVTNNPSDMELEVAVEAIKEYDKLEKKIERGGADEEVFISSMGFMILSASPKSEDKFS